MSNLADYNWKVCLNIDPDEDFWYKHIIPELDDWDTIALVATDDNVERVIEQLSICAMTIDAKDYLKESGSEEEYSQICQSLAMILKEFHEYKKRHDEWIDFSVDCPRGNQSFGIAVVPDYMFDSEWGGWCETSLPMYIIDDPAEYVEQVTAIIEDIESGAEGFMPGEYRPPAQRTS